MLQYKKKDNIQHAGECIYVKGESIAGGFAKKMIACLNALAGSPALEGKFQMQYISRMKAASIQEIKQELNTLSPSKLLELCLRLAKSKKDNKELLTYLLFDAHDETAYIESVKADMDLQFAAINQSNVYFAKKSLRKILRTTAKYIRHTASKQAEVELLLYFCASLAGSSIPFRKNTTLSNLYQAQLKKIGKTIDTLHEDLQYDYQKELKKLS